MQQLLSEEHIVKSMELVLKNIHRGNCEDQKPCTPATPEEFRNPPVSKEQARAAIKAGIVSGTMQWCQLKWERRNFRPFLLHFRNEMNARQLAIMALMHRVHQNAVFRQLSNGGGCPAETKEDMSRQMPLEELER